MYNQIDWRQAAIAAGASMSLAITLGPVLQARATLLHLAMPAAWTPAVVTVQGIPIGESLGLDLSLAATVAAQDAWPWRNLWDAYGNEVTLQADAGRAVILAPQDFMGFWALRFRSGPAAGPVPQAAGRTLTVAIRAFD